VYDAPYVYPGGRSNLTGRSIRGIRPTTPASSACSSCALRPIAPGFLSAPYISSNTDADADLEMHAGADTKTNAMTRDSFPTSHVGAPDFHIHKLIVDYGWHFYAVLPDVIEKEDRNTASISGVKGRCVIFGESESAPPIGR
jgi:hypothetical protein